jgi:hypothetical protein
MAQEAEVKRLTQELDAILAFNKEELVRRPKWGEINFEEAQQDLNIIFDIVNHLRLLPLEYIPDNAITRIINEVTQTKAVLDRVDKFNIQVSNPPEQRRSSIQQIHSRVDELSNAASVWIPFLAYQKGDVAKNIAKLTEAVGDAKAIISEATTHIAQKREEIEKIVHTAREAAGRAGVAVFTQDFKEESQKNETRATTWLRSTIILAAITLIIAGAMFYFPGSVGDDGTLVQKLGTKLAILVLLLSATAWCGRIYKALMHQATINRHRSLSLQTFQAFYTTAADDATKDAVLLQTTRSIFSDFGTGFVESHGGSSDSDIRVLEVIKSVLPKSDGK